MEILKEIGNENIAKVYIGKTSRGNIVEFVESVPTHRIKDKWVVIVSSLNGCPVGCKMCDAGFFYKGKLNHEEIIEQIQYTIKKRFRETTPQTKKFKIQFARVGEPSFNPAVLTVLESIAEMYPNVYPSLSTVAPQGVNKFFEKLLEIKKREYPHKFQLQFSIHTTDSVQRDFLIPIKKWNFKEIAIYGEKFYDEKGLKITLNFALAQENKVNADIVKEYFSSEFFLIKITPINPTLNAAINGIHNDIDLTSGLPKRHRKFVEKLKNYGYDVIVSIGDTRENEIGSNCGMYIQRFLNSKSKIKYAYTMAENFKPHS